MTTLAITGATGFVGQTVLAKALASGTQVRALTRQSQPARDGITWITGTLADAPALDRMMEGADTVLHIAGAVNVPTRAEFAAANIAGTQAVVKAATAAGARRFVDVSSLAAREPALSNYGWSKAQAEAVVQQSSLDWTIIRPPGVYGPGDSDMLEMFRMATRGFMLLPPPGRGSWIYVEDLARLLLATVTSGAETLGQTYEPDGGAPLTHDALAQAIGRAVGRSHVRTLSAPRWLLQLAARGDRLVRGNAAKLTPDRASYMAHPDWTSDPAKPPPAGLWQPRWAIEHGLAETAAHYIRAGLLAPPR